LDVMITEKFDTGLYHGGVSGVAFALYELYKATNDVNYRSGAEKAIYYVEHQARKEKSGTSFNDVYILRWGNAGVGFGFLYFYYETKNSTYLDLATEIGLFLISVGVPANGGMHWYYESGFGDEYPNYADGTAGIGEYFLTLYHFTNNSQFLDTASQAATYLLAIANKDNDGCMIYHDAAGKTMYYLSECNGPSGTGRFWYRFYQVTSDSTWLQWAERSAKSVRDHSAGVSPGYGFNWVYHTDRSDPEWPNYGQCDGNSGAAEYALLLSQEPKANTTTHLNFTTALCDDILAHATTTSTGSMYVTTQEWRTDSTTFKPQVGYMQGIAGMGSVFYGLDYLLNSKSIYPRIALPDSPWAFGFCCPDNF